MAKKNKALEIVSTLTPSPRTGIAGKFDDSDLDDINEAILSIVAMNKDHRPSKRGVAKALGEAYDVHASENTWKNYFASLGWK